MDGIFTNENANKVKYKSVEWYTPSWIFDLLGVNFDLDPSSPHDMDSMVPAKTKFTIYDDGLSRAWFGRVWMNPPYGRETGFWVDRFIDNGNGICLCFSRTDANWCQSLMKASDAILFLSGRVEFIPGHENKHKKSRSGAGTVMFAIGNENATALKRLSHKGVFIKND